MAGADEAIKPACRLVGLSYNSQDNPGKRQEEKQIIITRRDSAR